ncbi:MAG: tRNA preQ1(34) S-adenosylmethionine ribosyltransferase-isomerase QueA [Alphaproteobacteria bacterium]
MVSESLSRLDAYDFDLPAELIAERPAVPRDSARLLVVGSAVGGLAALEDRTVRDLPQLLSPGDVLVANDTRVVPARLEGQRGAAHIELTLHRRLGADRWLAFARPAKRLRVGDRIEFAGDLAASVAEKGEEGEVRLQFDRAGAALEEALERHGAMPLPPYIRRPEGPDARDRLDYQTLFARVPGAVAAPTAGLHFTPALIEALDRRGVARATLTLHVGAGTFRPIRVDDLAQHRMEPEPVELNEAAVAAIEAARATGGRVVAVGSTALRALEAATGTDGRLRPYHGETNLFIRPGYRFKIVDRLMTNFHLPRSTLFVLVAAFAGLGRMREAYAHAIRERYRFYSYGDCCLLDRAEGL